MTVCGTWDLLEGDVDGRWIGRWIGRNLVDGCLTGCADVGLDWWRLASVVLVRASERKRHGHS